MPIEFTPSSCKQNLLHELSMHMVEPHRSCPCFVVTIKKSSYIFHPRNSILIVDRPHTHPAVKHSNPATQTWTPSFDLAIVVCTTHRMFTTRAVLRAVPVDAGACGRTVCRILHRRLTSWYASCYQNAILFK